MDEVQVERILQNPKFKLLVSKKRNLSWSLTALMLFIYIGFILLVAYNPGFLHSSFSGLITWGIPLGLCFIFALFFLFFSNLMCVCYCCCNLMRFSAEPARNQPICCSL